jgi:hypothetical protein
MTTLRCIAYTSTAIKLMTEAELEALLLSARDFNKLHGVTGVLLYCDGSFMQYFEGFDHDVSEVYKRITNSRQHKGIIELLDQSIDMRSFPDWSMGYSRPLKSELIKLLSISWNDSRKGKNNSLGIQLLEGFWSRCNKFGN